MDSQEDIFMENGTRVCKANFKVALKNLHRPDEDFATFSGFAATFNNIDLQDDIIVRGAFLKTLQSGRKVKLLWQHNHDEIVGSLLKIEETDEGLVVEGRLNLGTRRGAEAIALLRAGDLDSMSIGFRVKKDEFDPDTGIRILKELELIEISLVSIPANPLAVVTDVKSIDELEKIADVNIFFKELGLSNKQIKTLISKIKNFSRQDAGEHELEQKEQDVVDVKAKQAKLDETVELMKRFNNELRG